MSVLINGMEMPESGTYEVSIDNTKGKDKTVMSLFVRGEGGLICCGVYELATVPPHGDLIDRDALKEDLLYDVEMDSRALDSMDLVGSERKNIQDDKDIKQNCVTMLDDAPTIIQAEQAEEGE